MRHTSQQIRVSQHACTRYAEHHPTNARVRDVLMALDAAKEVTMDEAFRLSAGNPLHPAINGHASRFFLTTDGLGLFVLRPDANRRGKWCVPTYLRLPQDPDRLSLIQECLLRVPVADARENLEWTEGVSDA